MTAEVAVLNSYGVALAADSAVTIGGGKKVLNSASKLFSLSTEKPVGIMVYANADFMGLPWEVIIKHFRDNFLRETSFCSLAEYANHFLKFLANAEMLNSSEQKSVFFLKAAYRLMGRIKAEIIENQKEFKTCADVQSAVKSELAQNLLPEGEGCPNFSEFLGKLRDLKNEIWPEIEFEDSIFRLWVKSVEGLVSKNKVPDYTGIVIAGYGDDNFLPEVISTQVFCTADSVLWHTASSLKSIGYNSPRQLIETFAQRDGAQTFQHGMDDSTLYAIDLGIQGLITEVDQKIFGPVETGQVDLSGVIVEKLTEKLQEFSECTDFIRSDDSRKSELESLVTDSLSGFKEILNTYLESISKSTIFGILHSVSPNVQVGHLTKGELASFAESLVQLTSLRRRYTMEMETVGGPVDVAVITKGEGFIWVKRKHYFDPKLNLRYKPSGGV